MTQEEVNKLLLAYLFSNNDGETEEAKVKLALEYLGVKTTLFPVK